MKASLLSAKVVPPEGGETEYASLRAAYAALPEDRKSELEGLVAEHSMAYSREQIAPGAMTESWLKDTPPAQQVLVRTIPETGQKALYVGSYASQIIGWPLEKGRALLKELLEWSTQPQFVYEHTWRTNDLVIWDNRSCLHRGRPWDGRSYKRFANSLDTLLVVGSSMSYFRVQSQGLRQPPHLIHLDIDPDSIGRWYDAEVSLVGHAGVVLEQLNDAVAVGRAQLEDGFAAEIEVVRDDIRDFKKRTMPGETKIMQTIRDVVADDAIFVGDVSICNHRGSNYCLEIYGERSYMIPAWGGLGFGLPAAIGAKAAFPDRQVICITGDGGLQFNIQEFATCVQYGISPVVIVFNDSAWGLLRQFQSARSERYIASDLRNPDFFQLTEAYGAAGWRVTSLWELRPALEAACASPALAVVDVQTPDGFARFA